MEKSIKKGLAYTFMFCILVGVPYFVFATTLGHSLVLLFYAIGVVSVSIMIACAVVLSIWYILY